MTDQPDVLPDFILIGAPKCGTTSIYHYLQQHPQIAMSALKEPHYFLFDGPAPVPANGPLDGLRHREMIRDWDRYQHLFRSLPADKVKGEASVHYLYSDQARQAIARRAPECRLLVMLRQPADRAYSAFQRDRMHNIESLSTFAEAIADGPRREREGWHIGRFERLGYYAQFLKPYLDTFGEERIKVFLFDDLVERPQALMHELFAFLGIDTGFEPDMQQRFNETGVISNPLIRFIWRDTRRLRSLVMPYVPMRLRGKMFNLVAGTRVNRHRKEPIDPALRAELTERYRDDILQLQDLIGRNLSHWLTPKP